jgi:hypothetical protein
VRHDDGCKLFAEGVLVFLTTAVQPGEDVGVCRRLNVGPQLLEQLDDAARFSLRMVTAPLVRASAAVSAACSSLMASVTVASAGPLCQRA